MTMPQPPQPFDPNQYSGNPQQSPFSSVPPQGQPQQPFGTSAPKAPNWFTSIDENVQNYIMIGVPLALMLLSMFLPYVKVKAKVFGTSYNQSFSLINAGGGFTSLLMIMLLLAGGALILPSVAKTLTPKACMGISITIPAVGLIALVIAITQWSNRNSSLGRVGRLVNVSRGSGYWLLIIASILLIAAGIYHFIKEKKKADAAQSSQPMGYPQTGQYSQPANQYPQGSPAQYPQTTLYSQAPQYSQSPQYPDPSGPYPPQVSGQYSQTPSAPAQENLPQPPYPQQQYPQQPPTQP